MKRICRRLLRIAWILAVPAILLAQDSGQSLGDLARKERERRGQEAKSGPHTQKVYTNEDFRRPPSTRPRSAQHVRFVDLQIGADRPGGDYFVFVPAEPKADLCRDECAKDPACKAFAFTKSNQPGSRPVCHLKSDVTPTVPDGTSISGIKASAGHPSEATSAEAKAEPRGVRERNSEETQGLAILGQLSADEARGLYNIQTIGSAEAFCRRATDVYIPLEDLKSLGCQGRGSLAPLRRTLMEDPKYDYTVTIGGDDVEIHAIPRHSALGGFFSDATTVFYNPSGPASESDTLISTHESLQRNPAFRQVTFKAMSAVLSTKK